VGSLAGTVRVVLGVLFIIFGIFGLLLFFIGIIGIIIGAILIWSGRQAQQQERTNQMLQQQQAQLAYVAGAQAGRPPYPAYGYGQPPAPAAGYYPPPPPPQPAYLPPAAQPLQMGTPSGLVSERFCPTCGRGNARTSAFCQGCGKPLPPPS